MKLNFSFTNKTQQKIPSGYFLSVLKNFIKKMKIKNPVEVNLILVNENEIKKINQKYRGKNKSTDTLSFPIDIANKNDLKKFKPSEKIILGDIYICPIYIEGVIKREIKEAKNQVKYLVEVYQETFLHSLIHLIGYDHQNDEEEKEWEKILKKIKK